MRILIVSDKEVPSLHEGTGNGLLKDIDCIISCGDLRASYLNSIVKRANAPLYYVAGNHDTHYFYERPHGTNLDNKIVEVNNLRLVGFEGSIRYNKKPYQYSEKEMRRKIRSVRFKLLFNSKIDIVVTHAPPAGIYKNVDHCHKGFESFRRFIEKYQPKYFLHGHYHLEYGLNVQREHTIGQTKIINCVGHYVLEL